MLWAGLRCSPGTAWHCQQCSSLPPHPSPARFPRDLRWKGPGEPRGSGRSAPGPAGHKDGLIEWPGPAGNKRPLVSRWGGRGDNGDPGAGRAPREPGGAGRGEPEPGSSGGSGGVWGAPRCHPFRTGNAPDCGTRDQGFAGGRKRRDEGSPGWAALAAHVLRLCLPQITGDAAGGRRRDGEKRSGARCGAGGEAAPALPLSPVPGDHKEILALGCPSLGMAALCEPSPGPLEAIPPGPSPPGTQRPRAGRAPPVCAGAGGGQGARGRPSSPRRGLELLEFGQRERGRRRPFVLAGRWLPALALPCAPPIPSIPGSLQSPPSSLYFLGGVWVCGGLGRLRLCVWCGTGALGPFLSDAGGMQLIQWAAV